MGSAIVVVETVGPPNCLNVEDGGCSPSLGSIGSALDPIWVV